MARGGIEEGPDGSLRSDADRTAWIIYVEGRGVWTEEVIDRHFDALTLLVEESRAAIGLARVFVDTRAAGDQTPAVEALLRSRIVALYEETDRVATLVAVDLRRISVAPRVSAGNRGMFDDPMAALRWLAQD